MPADQHPTSSRTLLSTDRPGATTLAGMQHLRPISAVQLDWRAGSWKKLEHPSALTTQNLLLEAIPILSQAGSEAACDKQLQLVQLDPLIPNEGSWASASKTHQALHQGFVLLSL